MDRRVQTVYCNKCDKTNMRDMALCALCEQNKECMRNIERCPYTRSDVHCKTCGGDTIKHCKITGSAGDEGDCVYGDCQYTCTKCGANGKEVFGHGMHWVAGR